MIAEQSHAPRPVDGLGQLLLHLLGRQHRGDLAASSRSASSAQYLYEGHVPLPWCTRCGTSLSQHEMLGSYVETEDLSLYVSANLLDGSGRALVLWTTTPWTLPANVAAAVHPTLRYEEVDWEGTVARAERGEPQASRHPRRRGAARAQRLGARRPRVRDLLPRPAGTGAGSARRDPVGRDRRRRGFGHRPHRARLRPRGLRAEQGARPRRDRAARRGRATTSTASTGSRVATRRSSPTT